LRASWRLRTWLGHLSQKFGRDDAARAAARGRWPPVESGGETPAQFDLKRTVDPWQATGAPDALPTNRVSVSQRVSGGSSGFGAFGLSIAAAARMAADGAGEAAGAFRRQAGDTQTPSHAPETPGRRAIAWKSPFPPARLRIPSRSSSLTGFPPGLPCQATSGSMSPRWATSRS